MLAADLRELVAYLCRTLYEVMPRMMPRLFPVGCSIGAAVLWTYVELFGDDFAGFVFVDQAPLRDRSTFGGWDERNAHRGCYYEKTLLAAQEAWVSRPAEAHRALVQECLDYRHMPLPRDGVSEEQARKDEELFVGISALCDGEWLARLMADHTRYDHREAIELISKPTLGMAGKRSGCFTLLGIAETVERIRWGLNIMVSSAEIVVFDSGYWLFYEEPKRFNRELLAFAERCIKR